MYQAHHSTIVCTVAICTYNGSKRVPQVLKKLENQVVSQGSRWDVVVIDNASSDNTSEICERVLEKFSVPAKVVYEAEPGLVFARRRAAQEAQGDIICFLDDDNLPSDNYVENAINAFVCNPNAGVIGGRVVPKWESPPTPLALSVAEFALAICDMGKNPIEVTTVGGGIVGAGMCVRTDLLRRLFKHEMALGSVSGRKGESLMSGDDLAISILSRKLGYKTLYEPSLYIEHVIPTFRMEKDYLLKLYEGIGRGQASVRRLYDWKARHFPTSLIIFLKDCVRYLKGMSIAIKTDEDLLNSRLLIGRIKESLRF